MNIHPLRSFNSFICTLRRKLEHLWYGNHPKIHAIAHRINILSWARHLTLATRRAGQKAQEIKRFVLNRQLNTGVKETPETNVPHNFSSHRRTMNDSNSAWTIASQIRWISMICIPDPYRLIHCTRRNPHLLHNRRIQGILTDQHWSTIPSEDVFPLSFWRISIHQYVFRNPKSSQNFLICTRYYFYYKEVGKKPVYKDYIIIYAKDVEKHVHHVNNIIDGLAKAVVTINLKMCLFFSDSVNHVSNINWGSSVVNRWLAYKKPQEFETRDQSFNTALVAWYVKRLQSLFQSLTPFQTNLM